MNRRDVGLVGPLADHAADFRKALVERRYADRSISTHCDAFADLSRWLDGEGLAAADLTPERVVQFLESRRQRGKRCVLSSFGIAPTLTYLDGLGLLPAAERPVPAGPETALRARYRAYLTHERGMAPHGVLRYEQNAALFVSSLAGEGDGVDWASCQPPTSLGSSSRSAPPAVARPLATWRRGCGPSCGFCSWRG